MRKLILALSIAALLIVGRVQAAVELHGLFTENMVLQQGTKVPVWGTADNGEKVTVRFQGQELSTMPKDGKWKVVLENLKPGGPFEFSVNDTKFKNVLVGEVWVCSGQSNMEWSVAASRDPKETIAAADYPTIRLFQVPKTPTATPQAELGDWKGPKEWMVCSPQTVPGFSAVGYHFGRHLQKARNVPVGLIQSAWGGTPAEVWTSKETLDNTPGLKGLTGSGQYNGMIAPLIPFAIKGVIWYQGESNASKAYQYRALFPAMIKNWRDAWGQGDFPFLFVQLAPYNGPKEQTWPELREAQTYTWLTVPNTGMAVITDYGHPTNIHPVDKDPVGERLALCARATAYKEEIPYSGPLYSGMKKAGDRIILSFNHVADGLVAKGGELTGFTIAGKDGTFMNAKATIEGKTVVVESPEVKGPVAVRYGWQNTPVVNLFNSVGLPASPFRTDEFPLLTAPKTN